MTENNKLAEKLFAGFPSLSLTRGQILVSPGKRPNFVYFLKKGFVKQYVKNANGEKLVIHQYRPGAFFHLKWLVSSDPNDYFFEAVTPTIVYRAPSAKIKELLQKNPELLWQTTQRLIKGLDGLSKRLEIITLNPTSLRVASLLSHLQKKYGNPIPFRLTHAEIASWVGTARETVSLEMEKLKKAGKIRKNKRFLELQKGK